MRGGRLLSAALLVGCAPGQLEVPQVGPTPPQRSEAGVPLDAFDAALPPTDAQPRPDQAINPCPEGCGTHAHCEADGCACDPGYTLQGGACVLADTCGGVMCGANAQCIDGDCQCVAGSVPQGDACVPADPCDGVQCQANARCVAGDCQCVAGHVPQGDACVPADPCAAVACGAEARCVDGACQCREAFIDDGAGGCVPAPQSPLEARTRDEVCDRWASVSWRGPEWVATPGSDDPCDPGTVTPEAQDAAIARTNLYRWLVGLEPVGLDESRLQAQQECAALMNAINALTHHPTPDLACYTQGAAAGAGSSNLALGSNITGSVDLYVGDRGVASLGHRRWVLNPGMRETTFGAKGRASCMYSFSGGGASRPVFVAWPPPGWLPTQAAQGTMSITLHTLRAGADFRVEAVVGEGALVDVNAERLGGNYGGGTVYAFAAPTGAWRDGAEMRVALRGLTDHDDVLWTTRWTSCQ
jgi:hypothetical protein